MSRYGSKLSKYGDFYSVVENYRGRKARGKDWSCWWRDLVRLCGDSEWFWEGLRKVVGDGSSTLFWDDV